MVADSKNKTALTMLRYEQRFNVAVSRARDRLVLVRSVRREELNPNDLKARLIAHFENPMPELEVVEDALGVCESNFERDLMQRLLETELTWWSGAPSGDDLPWSATETGSTAQSNGGRICDANVFSNGLAGAFGGVLHPVIIGIPTERLMICSKR
jgi:hypothetical protein